MVAASHSSSVDDFLFLLASGYNIHKVGCKQHETINLVVGARWSIRFSILINALFLVSFRH